MSNGRGNFDRLKDDATTWRPQNVERTAWAQVFLSVLTQASAAASFPSYNVVMGFWGLYICFNRSQQACQAYLWLLGFTMLLDLIFCSVWGSSNLGVLSGGAAKFCLAMLVLNMFCKAAALYCFGRLNTELKVEAKATLLQQRDEEISHREAAYDLHPMAASPQPHHPLVMSPASARSDDSNASFAVEAPKTSRELRDRR